MKMMFSCNHIFFLERFLCKTIHTQNRRDFQKNIKSGSLFKKVTTYSVLTCFKHFVKKIFILVHDVSFQKRRVVNCGYQFLPGFINWRPSCLGMGWYHSCRSLITALLFSYPLFLPCCRLYSQLTLFLRPALPCSQRENDAAGEPQNVAVMPPCTRDTTEWITRASSELLWKDD